MTTTKRDNVCKVFTIAGAVLCGFAGAAVSTCFFPLEMIAQSSATFGPIGMLGGAVRGFVTGNGNMREIGKQACIGCAIGITGLIGAFGVAAAAVGSVAGVTVGYPAQVIADWQKNNRARSDLTHS